MWLDMEAERASFQAIGVAGNIASNRERCTSHPIAQVIDTIYAVRDIIVHLRSFCVRLSNVGKQIE